ncbi:arylamine N-acetyltransferase [Pelagicoccus sp. NFK12]|uniref:Arylamine N-acetyltransferase n=1 Tax=Pelagicoccus enzymogenes TaxID=2773457 RepID=A0A927F676_9BACT|nr:arylamine N-acetyltransferase [Pelagicoccus enzymogenes]MBD5778957.1 arylamine N-acetyltransferase [Pelagicoccus enzymogenes]
MTTRLPQTGLDLSLYFSRIGYDGNAKPTLACLKQLHRLHEQNIPFENLDVLLGKQISIEIPSIFEKLVTQKRGGYCFEQNTLFAAVLTAIGFEVSPMLARVRWMAPADAVTPLSHMILRVETEHGPQLADVGFGGVGLVEPIALDHRAPQHLDFEPRRIVHRDKHLVHQIKLGEEWADVYQFIPEAVAPIDLDIGNWFSFTHPKARFRNSLLVAQLKETGRIIIADTEFIERDWRGNATRTQIKSQAELQSILSEQYRLQLPKDAKLPLFAS